MVLFRAWNRERRLAEPKRKLPISELCQYYTQTSHFDKSNLFSVSDTSDSQPRKTALRGPVLPGLRGNPSGLRIGWFKSPSHSEFRDVHRLNASFYKLGHTQNGTFCGLKPGTTVGWTKEEVTYLWTMLILYSNFIFWQNEPIGFLRYLRFTTEQNGAFGIVGSWFNELPDLRGNPSGLRIGWFKSPSHSEFRDVHRLKASFYKLGRTQNGTFSCLKLGTAVGLTED